MEELEDNVSVEDIKDENDTYLYKIKPKKRSLVERELETNLTERITSPIIINGDGTSTSRYGRARRLKTDSDINDTEKAIKIFKSPLNDKSPMKSPVYKMHASNSPIRVDSPSIPNQTTLDHQIESIYNENISLSRFSEDKKHISVRQSPKVYVRKDLIQTKEKEETITLIKHYSPKGNQKFNSHLNNALQRSCEKYSLNNNKQNGYLNNSSVVKTLDFDGNKRKKNREGRIVLSKNDIFELEAKCEYQVGDLAWAKMGTYPYWPCIVTRDPFSGMFVKKKLFGRVDRDVIHVTFFGDNGRRSWIVDNMLRKFLGQLEFEDTREKLTPEAKKKDPRCAAFFVSEKKMPQWIVSVEEAETLLREPKRLRIDLLNDMLSKARTLKTTPKGSRKVTRTDSDVSLSESLYDTLFSEDDSKANDLERTKNKTRNKSLDVSEVVTACLDNMVAKTGIIEIQKQSHMDRWLQKAKSKTPEKSQLKSQTNSHNQKQDTKRNKTKKNKRETDYNKTFKNSVSDNESLNEADNKLHAHQNEHDYSIHCSSVSNNDILSRSKGLIINSETPGNGFGIISKVESLSDKSMTSISNSSEGDDVAMSDICIAGQETIVNSEKMDIDGISNVVINNVKTITERDASIVDSAISNTLDHNIEVSENCTKNSKQKVDDENVNESKCSIISSNVNTHLGDLIIGNATIKDIEIETNLMGNQNTSTAELQTCFTNGHSEMKDSNYQLSSKHQKDEDSIPTVVCSNEASTKNNVNQSLEIQDSITTTEDQEKQDVNIAKTILSDKLVGNNVDLNMIDFNIDMNEISTDENCIVNDDSDLTIPEPNGPSDRVTTFDACNKGNNHANSKNSTYIDEFYGSSNMSKDNSSVDNSHLEKKNTKKVNKKKTTFNLNNNPLDDSVNKICSNIFHGDNTKIADSFKANYLGNEKIKSKNNISEDLTNGFAHNKNDVLKINPIINCNLYLSSEDDDESVNSTSIDINEFSNLDKYKTRFVKKNYKHLTLQDALLGNDTEHKSDIIDQEMESHEKFVVLHEHDRISANTHEELSTLDDQSQNNFGDSEHSSTDSNYAHEEVNTLNNRSENTTGDSEHSSTDSNHAFEEINTPVDRSENTTGDSEHSSTDSNHAHEEINAPDDRSQNTTEESERCLTDSNYTCDSDNKSLYSDTQTESTLITENTENTETIDADECTFDSLTQNGYHEPIKIGTESESLDGHKVSLHLNLSEEKAIMSGDELRLTPHGLEVIKESFISTDVNKEKSVVDKIKDENDVDTASIISTDSEMPSSRRKMRWKAEKSSVPEKKISSLNMEHPDFLQYLEFKQDAIYDEHPELSQDEITTYLYNTWLYEESLKTDRKKTDDIESASLVKGLKSEPVRHPKKVRKRVKTEKEKGSELVKEDRVVPKQKPKRRTVRPSYNEEYSDVEEDLEVFSIPLPKDPNIIEVKIESGLENINDVQSSVAFEVGEEGILGEIDEVEEYFARLTDPKPNVFKGLLREKVCEICEKTGNLIKCKGCSSMFHVNCVKQETNVVEIQAPMKGRKKKKKFKGRKSKSDENVLDESQSDEKDANVSEELGNISMENVEPEPYIIANAVEFEAQLAIKMKELLGDDENNYNETFSSDDELDWSDTEIGQCKVVDIKLRKKEADSVDYSDFKCNNCLKYDVPICFVCRCAESPKNNALHRQRCQIPQCNKYYHLECLEHWPQTQFNSGECARYNKKINEYFEALSCPRHVCHTCVSDDPRGCKTRFSGDKLARCVRCPATYHTFTKCLPAGSQILTGSHIICPRHHEHRPGKVPCHVNTGWCFICALGGTLICCEYCPTSFHAECLNIKPPEGGYMCEDCETGRLPLYGEMVWVKLGHYRWWPGIILHPCEIPENILAVKHSPGEFVVRFFGQYDHYWVNRGRVFPFQEGDSGKVSSQKSKIDAAFTMAMEHAQRACEILKTARPNEEESSDIASSLLPPHYVKLRVNKPCGALCGRRIDEESSLTQCECSPDDELPCGPYSHCLNRMLLTECGPTCRAGDRCNNRAFEKRLYPKLVPYRTPYRGWGLKTLEDIKAGQFVIEYVGELIDEEEFQRRMRRKHEIRDENFYFLTLDKERMIDAGPKGNLARFMNHCCEPNCETQKWTVLGDVRVGLFALYDIAANSEVTFNYNLESAGIEKKRCLCGAKRCSGYIGAKPKQTEQPKKAKRPYNKKRKIDDSPSTSKIKPKPKLGRPPKPKELTEIEKDLLIIKNATNGISSDSDCSGRLSSIESIKDLKASKRKRVGHSTEDSSSNSSSPSTKKMKLTEEKSSEVCDTGLSV